jgi:hypothetical protein
MSKAAELAALIGSQTALSNRNLIINGAMQVAQRGTSTASVTGNGYHACDRWNLELSSLGTFTISQSTDAPAGFSNSFKVDCTTADASPAASDYMVVQQKIEAQTLRQLGYGASGAKAMTLSFYVKSNKTGTYEIMHFAADGTRAVNSTYTIDSANTWEFKSVSIPGDTGGTMNNDNGEGLRSLFYLGVGSDRQSGTTPTDWQAYATANEAPSQTVNIADNTANEWLITGVQLEVGEQATPFEHRSFGDELRRCKRYFERFAKTFTSVGQASEANCGLWSGMSRSGNSGNNQGVMTYQTKRTNPSISVSSAAHINGVFPISPFAASLSSFGIDGNAGIDNCFVNAANNASSAPSSDCGSSGVMGDSSGTLDIDAEL